MPCRRSGSPALRLTPEQFALICAENREAVLESAADGSLIVMTPTGSQACARNSRLEMRLLLWAGQQGGWKVFGSSTSFRLSDSSVLSPDASLVRLVRWQALTPEQRRGFAPLCPDLVVELASPSDEGPAVLRRCAARWPFTWQMEPGLSGCSSPTSRPWSSGPPTASHSDLKY